MSLRFEIEEGAGYKLKELSQYFSFAKNYENSLVIILALEFILYLATRGFACF